MRRLLMAWVAMVAGCASAGTGGGAAPGDATSHDSHVKTVDGYTPSVSAQCLDSCPKNGNCHWNGKACEPVSEAACRMSDACGESGKCSYRPTSASCLAQLDSDCQKSALCASGLFCTAWHDECKKFEEASVPCDAHCKALYGKCCPDTYCFPKDGQCCVLGDSGLCDEVW